MRRAVIERNTKETQINVSLTVDGTGEYRVNTGCGFLDHMLELFAKHGRFDLEVECKGDHWIDYHHTVEDVGIVLGQAFKTALGEKRGIVRYGDITVPMDEALVMVALDISGRSYTNVKLKLNDKVGDFDTELVSEFFFGFSRELGLNLHVVQMEGRNTHHIIEATFKGVARAMMEAVEVKYGDQIQSTKGVL